ncbi:DegV family protein [Chloroflexota bacterium]
MVKVVTDSSCDIPPEIANKLSITIVPLCIELGGKTYRDGIDIDVDRIYHELVHGQETPKTSVPPPGDFIEVYNNLAAATDQIISIHLAPGYSGTYNAASLAKTYLDNSCRVEVIDSNSASVGLGLIAIAAAKAAQEGKDLDKIVDLVHQIISRTHIFGKCDSFPHILQGKRLHFTRVLILLGNISMVLHMKMLGEIYDGGKVRSPAYVVGLKMALNQLKRWAKSFETLEELAIAYTTMPQEAEMLAECLEPLFPRERMLITRLGCATSTYLGPGTLAMGLVHGEQL